MKPVPYKSYQSSGVEWLGNMPEHWYVTRGKNLFTKVDRPVREGDEVVTCFRDGSVTLRKNRRTRGFTESLKEIGYQGIRTGDLVIHAMDAFAGAVGVADSDGKGTPVYAVCEPKPNADAHYHAFVIREMARSQWILSLATGIRERSTDFRFGTYASQRVPLPPLPEQKAIVRYLNYFDRRIRRYIAAKQKLIGLLEEQKRAIIHRAVTRGLDPDVPLKDSGVEWLGEVPEHWNVLKLRDILRWTAERNCPDLPLLSVVREKGVIMREVSNKEENHNFIPDDLTNYKMIRVGQFAMNKMKAWQGSYGISPFDGIVSPAYYTFDLSDVSGVCGNYLHVAIRSKTYIPFFAQASDGVRIGQWDLSQVGMREIPFAVPPLPEQTAIVEYLDKATATIDTAITRARREIELLNEYRTRLTADVVTGKLDVREAAAGLPDEPEAPPASCPDFTALSAPANPS